MDKSLSSSFRVDKGSVNIPLLSGGFLKGKTVLVTGGNRGIGYAIAEACLRNEAHVIIAGRNIQKLELSRQKLIESGFDNSCLNIIQIDISKVGTFNAAINDAAQNTATGKIDILVNNAGAGGGKSIGATAETDFDFVLDTNLKGTYFMCQEFANYLIANQINGSILNISSVSGIRPAISPYMLSKWGITGLTKGLAKKLIAYGIVVNGIAPGPTATEMLHLDGSDLAYSRAPAGRYCAPAEVANLAAFLISDMGRMIVGETIVISGGCGNLTVDDMRYN